MYSIEAFYDHFVVCKDGEILYHVDNKKQAQDDIREMEQNTELEKDIVLAHNSKNYTVYHLHDDNSLLDSCTSYKLYIDRAVELGQKAICFTNHGNIYNWVEKKMYCDEKGIKYIFGNDDDLFVYSIYTNDAKGKQELHIFNITPCDVVYAQDFNSYIEIIVYRDGEVIYEMCVEE